METPVGAVDTAVDTALAVGMAVAMGVGMAVAMAPAVAVAMGVDMALAAVATGHFVIEDVIPRAANHHCGSCCVFEMITPSPSPMEIPLFINFMLK